MQTLIVTGGAGFIGSNFVRYMLSKYPDYRVIVLDALTYAGNLENLADVWKNPNFTFIQGDIADAAVVNNLAQNADAIVNFAAETHNDRSILNPEVAVRSNFNGVFTLLEAARTHKHTRFHHISCYDETTRALTKNGLKHYWEIEAGESVLSLNPATGAIEEKTVEKVLVQDYQGDMIHFQNSRVNLAVTPNHRMLFSTPHQPEQIQVATAEELMHRAIAHAPRGHWNGKTADTIFIEGIGHVPAPALFYVAGMFLGDGFLATQTQYRPNKTGLGRADFLKQCRDKSGRFVQTGKLGNQDLAASICHRIFFDIPETDKGRKRLEAAFDCLGICWSAHRGRSGEHLYFSSLFWSCFFMQFGEGAANKTVPAWMLDYNSSLLQCLFDGLIDSDGHYRLGNSLPDFSTSSSALLTGILEIGVKLGYHPRFSLRKTDAQAILKDTGRVIRPTQPAYMVYFRRENFRINKSAAHTANYQGKIWCLKVQDNKNFIAERGGILTFCGNTDEVYGSTSDVFKEGDPLEPNQPYSAAKAGGELMVRAYHQTYGLPTIVTRGSNTFGPYQYPEKIIPLFVTNLIDDIPVPVYGDGMQVRDWMHVEDHCRGVDAALHHGTPGEVYNVGGGSERPNLTLTHLILQHLGKPETLIRYVQDRPGHDRRYSIECAKMHALGWKPQCPFEESLQVTIDWYVSHQDWWRKIKEKQREYQTFMQQWYAERK